MCGPSGVYGVQIPPIPTLDPRRARQDTAMRWLYQPLLLLLASSTDGDLTKQVGPRTRSCGASGPTRGMAVAFHVTDLLHHLLEVDNCQGAVAVTHACELPLRIELHVGALPEEESPAREPAGPPSQRHRVSVVACAKRHCSVISLTTPAPTKDNGRKIRRARRSTSRASAATHF